MLAIETSAAWCWCGNIWLIGGIGDFQAEVSAADLLDGAA